MLHFFSLSILCHCSRYIHEEDVNTDSKLLLKVTVSLTSWSWFGIWKRNESTEFKTPSSSNIRPCTQCLHIDATNQWRKMFLFIIVNLSSLIVVAAKEKYFMCCQILFSICFSVKVDQTLSSDILLFPSNLPRNNEPAIV